MSAVHVEQTIGSATFSQAVADVFEHDELTVSAIDEEHDLLFGPSRVFAPGSWLHATVFDDDGNVINYFASSTYQGQVERRLRDRGQERKSA